MSIFRSCAAILLTAASLGATAMPALALPHGGTSYDLGVNTGRVPFTTAGVTGYLAGLPSETRSVILSSCAHYMSTPNAASSQDTIDFCGLVLNTAASGNVRTFSAVTPIVPAVPAPVFINPYAPTTPNLRPNCAMPHYTVDPTDPCY